MGDKRRNIIDILSLLFVIFFGCGVIGYMNREKTPDTPAPVNPTITAVEYTGVEHNIEGLNDRLSIYEFVKANREFSSSYLTVLIEGNDVKLRVQKAGITNATDTTPDPVEYTISTVPGVVAVQAQMLPNETNLARVYMLDSNGRLFCAMLAANPATHNGIVVYEYKVSNVESFTTVTTPLDDNYVTDQVYTVFKTTDGVYYTDYLFSIDSNMIITKLGVMEYQPEYIPQEENTVVDTETTTEEVPEVVEEETTLEPAEEPILENEEVPIEEPIVEYEQ